MTMAILALTEGTYRSVRRHLLPWWHRVEEASFLYVVPGDDGSFASVEWFAVPASGFASRSAYHLELSDETRAMVIKRAHDLGASLVELHSHVGRGPARFSPSDLSGFRDFVPHVFWRLKNRPYLAVVMTRTEFDGFAWTSDPHSPERLRGIQAGRRLMPATGLSPLPDSSYDERPL
jgi:hypothetical protein